MDSKYICTLFIINLNKMKKIIFCCSILVITLSANAQVTKEQKKDSIKELKEVIISTEKYKYKRIKSATVSKMPLADIENPQVYNTVTSELIKEQVVTNFNDVLKNATGVSRIWEATGRGGDGAAFYSMRGFALQPTMINGLPGINNGNIDPANVDNVEVMKGPSGTLYGGSLISYGGLINIVTKKPYDKFGGEIGYVSGSYGQNRVTADINVPLTDENNVLLRVNTAYQYENSFQNAGFAKTFFFAPSLTYVANDKLTFMINTEFSSGTSAIAPMLFLSRYSPISFSSMELFDNNYKNSFTSNQLTMSNPTFNMQAQMLYKLSENWNSQTVLSTSNSQTDGYYAYLWDSANGNDFTRFISYRNGDTSTTDIQQNFIGNFKIGNLKNRIIVGLEYYDSNINNGSSGYVADGTVSLADGSDTGDLTKAGVDNLLVNSFEGNSTANNKIMSAFVSDILNITDRLSAMVSLRVDNFSGATNYYTTDEISSQTAFSPKFGAVYQIVENKVSVFGNYMNGFVNVAPQQVSDIDGTNTQLKSFDPEHANQFEFGLKTNLFKEIVSGAISYYDIVVKDRLMTDPNNINNAIQGGEVKSNGVEVSLTATPMAGLNLIAGYSYNHSEVTKDNPGDGYIGLRPEEAGPENLVNFWANYTQVTGKLKGFGIGIGGNYASEQKTLNREAIGTFELPSYTIINSVVSYSTDKFNLSLKLNNILNEEYYTGWSTVSPQKLRNLAAGLTYKF